MLTPKEVQLNTEGLVLPADDFLFYYNLKRMAAVILFFVNTIAYLPVNYLTKKTFVQS